MIARQRCWCATRTCGPASSAGGLRGRCRSCRRGSSCRGDIVTAAPRGRRRRWRPASADDRSISNAAPAIRFLLIELPDAQWRLVITAHHIVIDGWSLPVFVNETDDPVPGRRRPWPRCPSLRGRTGTTSAGWRAAIRQASQQIWRRAPGRLAGPDPAVGCAGLGRGADGDRACRGAPNCGWTAEATAAAGRRRPLPRGHRSTR